MCRSTSFVARVIYLRERGGEELKFLNGVFRVRPSDSERGWPERPTGVVPLRNQSPLRCR